MIPIGTTVYSFLDCPFRVVSGTVIEHKPDTVLPYLCKWYDPYKKEEYEMHDFAPHLTAEEAKEARDRIQSLFDKHCR